MMTTENLRECPFCGGNRAFCETVERSNERRPYGPRYHRTIVCMDCQATTGPTGFDPNKDDADSQANNRWNTRPLESALEARVKELEAELAQARAAAEKLIRHIEAVECVACPYRSCRCAMGHDEPCYTRIKAWAYSHQEVEE